MYYKNYELILNYLLLKIKYYKFILKIFKTLVILLRIF